MLMFDIRYEIRFNNKCQHRCWQAERDAARREKLKRELEGGGAEEEEEGLSLGSKVGKKKKKKAKASMLSFDANQEWF